MILPLPVLFPTVLVMLIGNSKSIGIGGIDSNSLQNNQLPMALVGRVLTEVSLVNGPIQTGDSITTSNIPGVGMKATQAGPIVGKAMEGFNQNSPLTDCVDPTTGNIEKCGLIVVYANISWYDPDIFLTQTGQVAVNFNVSDEVLAKLGYSGTKNEIETATYSVTDATGSVITRMANFAQITTGKSKLVSSPPKTSSSTTSPPKRSPPKPFSLVI